MTAAREDVSVGDCVINLSAIADELVSLSQALQFIERDHLYDLERAYEQGLMDFEAGLFEKYEKGEGKWPGEETRERLYRRTMPTDTLNELMRYQAARKRAEKRIASFKAAADSWRSILSALKVEMEASR